MNSKEMNDAIREIEGSEEFTYESFGGKVFPYIGWFWRDVDFSSKDYSFGVLPVSQGGDIDYNTKERVGFMENNKWDYDYIECPPDKWENIKNLIEIAIKERTYTSFKNVDDEIQSLLITQDEGG